MIQYTEEELKKLYEMSAVTSPMRLLLKRAKFSHTALYDLLIKHHQTNAIKYLFQMPLDELPLKINDRDCTIYVLFRLSIAK